MYVAPLDYWTNGGSVDVFGECQQDFTKEFDIKYRMFYNNNTEHASVV